MFLLASAAVFLGHQAQRCSTAAPDRMSGVMLTSAMVVPRPTFVPPPGFSRVIDVLAGNGNKCWDTSGLAGTAWPSRCAVSTIEVVTRNASAARSLAGQRESAAAAGQSDAKESGDDDDDDEDEIAVSPSAALPAAGEAGEPRRHRGPRSLQERLNSMSLDFSSEDREPYIAGAPRTAAEPGSSSTGGLGSTGEAEDASSGRPALVRHSLYRRRKRPSYALCMPKHQRPQGCAPLLPMENQDAVVDYITPEQGNIGELSEFRSDLPCVKNGTCPLPAFRCPKGHVWEANGSPVCFYCPVCADARVTSLTPGSNRRKRDLEVIQQIAEQKGGVCLSDTYLGMQVKLHFQCSEGHDWLSTPSNLAYKNTWCPKCASLAASQRKRLTIADMHQTARQFGGEFLSSKYLGAAVKHEWRCHRGHLFWQTPNNVRRSEGGLRSATFCKKCTILDRDIIKASVLGGIGGQDLKRTAAALAQTGAMPTRKHFLPRRRKRRPRRPPVPPKESDGGGGGSGDGKSTPE